MNLLKKVGSLYTGTKKQVKDKVFESLAIDPPHQPLGPNFGLTIYPEFVDKNALRLLRENILHSYTNQIDKVVRSDGRVQIPPINPNSFLGVVEYMENEGWIPRGWVNNQTVNMYNPGDFIRAHIDNLFVYDDLFVVLSYGAPQIIKFVHAQTGEELEAVIPECSVYTLQGPARYVYFHMLLPVETQRCSVVLRRSILNTKGSFRTVAPPMDTQMLYKANAMLDTIITKGIGSPRLDVNSDWLEKENLGPFDTAKWVKTLKPLRDWTLQSQLDEDEAKLKDLYKKGWIEDDMSWRVKHLRKVFRQVEEDITINKSALPPIPNA